METFLQEAKASSRVLSTLSGTQKNKILKAMAQGLRDQQKDDIRSKCLRHGRC